MFYADINMRTAVQIQSVIKRQMQKTQKAEM